MEHYTVSELAFGDRWNRNKATRNEPICILADVRGRLRSGTWQVFNWTTQKIVHLSKDFQTHTPGARRWHAISVPRWLVNKEGLWSAPVCPPDRDEEHCQDMRTMQMLRDDGDLKIARMLVAKQNEFTPMPGQRMQVGGYDLDGGRSRRR